MVCCTHFFVLFKKNLILWKRGWVQSVLEILIPAAFALLFGIFRYIIPYVDIKETSFVANSNYILDLPTVIDASWSPVQQFLSDESKSSLLPKLKLCGKADSKGSTIAFAPDNDITQNIKSQLQIGYSNMARVPQMNFDDSVISYKFFNTRDEMFDYIEDSKFSVFTDSFCFAVAFDQSDTGKYNYRIMFNSSNDDDLPNQAKDAIDVLAKEDITTSLKLYVQSGYLTLQSIIDNILIKKAFNDPAASAKAQIASVRLPAYQEDQASKNFSSTGDLFMAFPILWPFLRLVAYLIEDKERRIKEGMKMMGMSESAWLFSFAAFYFIVFTIVALLNSILIVAMYLNHSKFILFFIWYWFFCMSMMALAFFCASLFSRVRLGTIGALIIFLLFYLIRNFLDLSTASEGAKGIIAFISPPSNLFIGQNIILGLSAVDLDLNTDTFKTKFMNFSVSSCVAVSFFSSVFYFLLGVYFEQVLPKQFGVRKNPFFCFICKRRKRKGQGVLKPLYQEDNPAIEPVDPALKAQDEAEESLVVRQLRKVYPSGKVAVGGISLTMYQNQIFSLLGHNGAGKTSLISVLTGLYPMTSGEASVFGLSITNDMDTIRKRLGVCPQYDILFPKLTVREHLKMYATFKGMTKGINEEADKMIRDMDLWEKRDYLAGDLSGGQKRRLSVGMAFIGGSDIIFLDEPSSGMDTSARRSLWEMLKNYKTGRIVILTTHFMDEADFLGDRIGIMGGGKLLTCGRSLFLKSKFGVGYKLTIMKKNIQANSQHIINIIKKHIPVAVIVEGQHQGQQHHRKVSVKEEQSPKIELQLPSESTPQFSALFEELDSKKDELHIDNYGISVTTLEEVFLKVAETEAKSGEDLMNLKRSSSLIDKQKEVELTEKEMSPGAKSQNQSALEDEFKTLKNTKDTDEHIEYITGRFSIFRTHFLALILKKWHYFKRDKKGLCCELLLPVVIIIIGLGIMQTNFKKTTESVLLLPEIWPQPVNTMYNSKLPGSVPVSSSFLSLLGTNLTQSASNAIDLASFDQDVFSKANSFDPSLRIAYFIETEDSVGHNWKYTALVNTTAIQAPPLAITHMSNTIIKQSNPDNYILHSVSYMPETEQQNKKTKGLVSGITAVFLFTMALSFISASLISYIVMENETKVKHQQIVSGVSISAYWLSSYFLDVLKYVFVGVAGPLLVLAFDVSSLVDNETWSITWLAFIFFGTANISFTYFISFFFSNAGGAQIAAFFINMLIGVIGAVTLGSLRLFDSTKTAAQGVAWVLRLFPSFSYANGLFLTTMKSSISYEEGWYPAKSAWSIQLAGADIMMLIVDTFLYIILVFVLEFLRSKQFSFGRFFGSENSVKYEDKSWDSDVAQENLKVAQSQDTDYALKVDKVRKVFMLGAKKHKVAVDRISFGVEQGEVFALLGVNGAGKTTTFKMMSGEIAPTDGKVCIKGLDISTDMTRAQKFIGYCPQFDALLYNLTTREHLQMFAAIKGIPPHQRARLISQKIEELGLKPFENIPAGTYSGGNKRKLSVAIATIGNPPVVFLDEPSTGMDPGARRFMWEVIKDISTKRKQSSIVLTTHSMDEAEHLSTRMAIQVDGMLKCIGSVQHIITKFGDGYEMEVKLYLPDEKDVQKVLRQFKLNSDQIIGAEKVNEILRAMDATWLEPEIQAKGTGSAIHNEQFLKQSFGNVSIIEHFQTFFRYKVVTKVSISNIFGSIEGRKDDFGIQQYSVGQATIEQIFNLFATGKLPVENQHVPSPNTASVAVQKATTSAIQLKIASRNT